MSGVLVAICIGLLILNILTIIFVPQIIHNHHLKHCHALKSANLASSNELDKNTTSTSDLKEDSYENEKDGDSNGKQVSGPAGGGGFVVLGWIIRKGGNCSSAEQIFAFCMGVLFAFMLGVGGVEYLIIRTL